MNQAHIGRKPDRCLVHLHAPPYRLAGPKPDRSSWSIAARRGGWQLHRPRIEHLLGKVAARRLRAILGSLAASDALILEILRRGHVRHRRLMVRACIAVVMRAVSRKQQLPPLADLDPPSCEAAAIARRLDLDVERLLHFADPDEESMKRVTALRLHGSGDDRLTDEQPTEQSSLVGCRRRRRDPAALTGRRQREELVKRHAQK